MSLKCSLLITQTIWVAVGHVVTWGLPGTANMTRLARKYKYIAVYCMQGWVGGGWSWDYIVTAGVIT